MSLPMLLAQQIKSSPNLTQVLHSTPNPISPSVVLDISDTAKTKLKESTSMSN